MKAISCGHTQQLPEALNENNRVSFSDIQYFWNHQEKKKVSKDLQNGSLQNKPHSRLKAATRPVYIQTNASGISHCTLNNTSQKPGGVRGPPTSPPR